VNDPDALAQARARWQRYRAAGHVLSYWQQTDAGAWQKKSAAET
jgi:DNA polymerase-3 subunit chi